MIRRWRYKRQRKQSLTHLNKTIREFQEIRVYVARLGDEPLLCLLDAALASFYRLLMLHVSGRGTTRDLDLEEGRLIAALDQFNAERSLS